MALGNRQGLGHLLPRDVHPLGNLLHRRLAAELLLQGSRALADPVQRPRAVQRHPDYAALLRQCLEDRLPDPPDRVRYELDALGLVELVRGANEPEVALVDEVAEAHSLILVLLRDRHHETQIAAHQLVERLLVPRLDRLCEHDLFLTRDQRIPADLPQVLIQGAFVDRGLPGGAKSHACSSSADSVWSLRDTTTGGRTYPYP